MALIKSITTPADITINNAYARIETISGNKGMIDFTLLYYVSQQAMQDGKLPAHGESFTFTPSIEANSENFIRQGYEYLKTLPEFAQATDA